VKNLVLIADDTEVVRSIRLALRSSADCRVVANFDGRFSARTRLSEVRPDIVLVDEMCQRTNVLARLRDVREAAPAARAVLMCDGTESGLVGDALASGAHAVLSRRLHPAEFGSLLSALADGAVVHLSAGAHPVSPSPAHRGLALVRTSA
jgi:DNA-binding NarL/FixJ family response regulator